MRKKKKLVIGLIALTTTVIHAQDNIGIGTVAPHQSAILDINATDKGVLFPRIALNKQTILAGGVNPIGVVVFNNGAGEVSKKGVYFWNGNNWELLALDSDVTIEIDNIYQKIEQIKPPVLIIGNTPVFANEVLDNRQVYIGKFEIEVSRPNATTLTYNTTIKQPLAVTNFDQVIDAKIYDSTGTLVLQQIADITTNGGLSFYFGTKNMYTTLPIGSYTLVLKYKSTLPAS
ncbi:hypothetical protein [Myroides odoratus]|uniref:Por secretion system C-terminal sorting domain n=1 Tax=Myroides odoratus TaxID=256 RepID=A0A9Q6Z3Q3_MYROD|nr:hypothetical protein [Myroides odoratus]EHQ41211.1 hypothetical protein Myrod_0373 [Myroides odoratus DSM 2801]EKB08508.1 hypothetical protein HMPREF9716_00972 [Myroides odoratus CIP 103059]QQT98660.1 hypothetical protein I6I88_10535 [Myroides odoratus]WQD59166.1 hypothetical protein U0010_08440 [Myroides odoratus]STZ32248.1 Uncharacterised protein [Myroides odoratus]